MADPIRRRLFLVWTAWIWLAWLFSGEITEAIRMIPALIRLIGLPPWPAAGEAARGFLHAILGAALVAAADLGTGAAILRFFGRKPERSWLVAAGAGIPALALLAQAVGLLGLADPLTLGLIVLGPAATALPLLLTRRARPSRLAGPKDLLRATIFASVGLVWLAALSPAVAWDEIVYHLRVPSVYLLNHKITPIPEIFPSYFPFSGEMLMMLAGNLGGDQAAKLLHAFSWLSSGLVVAALAHTMWGTRAGACALGLALTLPLGQAIGARGYVEFFLALPLLGALLVLLEERGGKAGWKLPLAGWLAGGALGVKYLGGIYAVILGSLILLRRSGGFKAAFTFSLFATAACFCWFMRNILWTGNPSFPLLWGGLHWTWLDMAGWRADAQAFEFDPSLLLATPWLLLTERSGDGGISPMLPIGIALTFLTRNRRNAHLWTVLGVMFLLWWISAPLPRYLMPVLLLLCALVAGPLAGNGLEPKTAGRIWRMTLVGIAGAFICGIGTIHSKTGPFGVVFGKITRNEYRREYFRPRGYMKIIDALENMASPRERVYFLGHLHSYPLARRTWFEFLYTRPALYWWLHDADTPERIRIRARQAGLTYIVHQSLGAESILAPHPERMQWTPAMIDAYRTFWLRYVRERLRLETWTIYEITDRGDAEAGMQRIPGTEGYDKS